MTIPFCTNCKHVSVKHYSKYCAHPIVGGPNPVDGEFEVEPCYALRDSTVNISGLGVHLSRGKCGPEGRLFEAKEPIKQTLLNKIANFLF